MTHANATILPVRAFSPQHFRLEVAGKVATITLDRPDRKNPLTFESYAELRDLFRALPDEPEVKAVVITGAGGNFSSGGGGFGRSGAPVGRGACRASVVQNERYC